jgi:hypothetical protein
MQMRELEILDLSVKFRNVALWRGLQPRDADTVAFEFLIHLMNPSGSRTVFQLPKLTFRTRNPEVGHLPASLAMLTARSSACACW